MSLLDILIPHSCVLCGKIGSQLCYRCFDYIDFLTGTEPAIYYPDLPLQAVCRFNPASQHLMHRYKYSGYWALSSLIGTLMYNHINLPKVDVVTWVPSHSQRIHERGFDHMRKVAGCVATQLQVPLVELLAKKQHTEHQAANTSKLARKNNPDLFRYVHQSKISPETTVLLLDDVVTTGSTLHSCIAPLSQQGHQVFTAAFCVRI